MKNEMSRREMLRNSSIALATGGLTGAMSLSATGKQTLHAPNQHTSPCRVSLNTSTIRGYQLPVEQQIDLCAEAGFDGIELWVSDVEAFIKQGGTAEDLRRRIREHGLVLENMISFSTWIADDPAQRTAGVKKMRQDMELTARLGGAYIAAPVQGVPAIVKQKLPEYSERYCVILEEGVQANVTPILELWGGGALHRLDDTAAIAIGAAHPNASLLLDFYHLYRGGNSFDSLRLLNGGVLPVFHINDYPASIPREALEDADRVFPGDGCCPFDKIMPILSAIGFRGAFSIELFNKAYWESMDVMTLLKRSFEKTAAILHV
ncbi:Sugar phosphate isomerase/epimerase [Parapedobacter indicus]|uniref:Sugar phosphate isomerase/epimerase n=2 Tax=Parapedobacter indicus TaxID=1477437 RepID=A0A1I3GQJ4_9SPHI|nr:sugar phosphate isomerase/epimerase [Parapedobacter indicus]SFI25629.1 Sugar phosphate isomerase/epimerase [Parapedobacter indicus]